MKKIDISKVKSTLDGSEVLELHRLEHVPGYAWVGVIRSKESESMQVETWTEEGKFFRYGQESDLDLVETSPYEGWKVDDKVWVKTQGGRWIPKHFSRVDSEGNPCFFPEGTTSFSSPYHYGEMIDVPVGDERFYTEIRLASEFTPG
jgi:hypothetical protein